MDGRSLRVLLKTLRDNGVTRYKCEDVEIELGAAFPGTTVSAAKTVATLSERTPPQGSIHRLPPKIKDLESLRMVPPPAAMEVDGDG